MQSSDSRGSDEAGRGPAVLVLASRLVPDLDGGFTIATLARAGLLADAGLDVAVLTVDPGSAADHAAHRAELVARGALDRVDRMRNLFDEAGDPAGGPAPWLQSAAHRSDMRADAARTITDTDGRVILDLPVISGDPDWHLSTAPVLLRGAAGEPTGALDGFGALYRAWLDHVIDGLRAHDPDRDVVVLCEARQLGELIVGWRDDVRIVHTVHTSHLASPYTEDAPVNPLWARWLGIADRFDAVLWPTPEQRDDAVRRFALTGRHLVVPHAVPVQESAVPVDPGRIVMLNRLAPGKRVDHAVRAAAMVPGLRLDIFGDGPLHADLEALVAELSVGDRVVLHGATTDPARVLASAGALVSSSAYEGQGLAIAEALAAGVPVVSYDVRYGPRDMLRTGGILVPDGDIEALAAALARVLDPAERAHLATGTVASAARRTPAVVTAALVAALDR